MKLRTLTMLAAAGLLVASAAQAATEKFAATLSGDQEVPANTTTGKGKVEATLDTGTKALSYRITYSGLTGPAMAAHFHGPAAPGANAPPVVPIAHPSNPTTGKATLTDAQIADLEAGKWYFNVHTSANPGGEIRGQIQAAK
jgi:CHRD domain